MNQPQEWNCLKLVGGRLCLDFVNTVDRDGDQYSQEWFHNATDLISWAQHIGILSVAQAEALLHQIEEQPERATTVFDRAIQLRETLYRIFSAIAAQKPQHADDLELLNTLLSEMQRHLHLVATDSRFIWEWTQTDRIELILWQIVRATADLLTSNDRDRIRECAGVGCGWVFLDFSRNRSRRWCDMEDCGNRAKAYRHYDRKRKK